MDLELLASTIYVDAIKFYHSGVFSVIKFLAGVYAIVLFVDIVLLLIHRGLGGNLTETMTGMNIPRELTTNKKKTRKTWQKIRQKLETSNENDYKVAIIEADAFIEDIITRLGYDGDNFAERLRGIPDGQIENIEGIKEAHELRNRIIHDDKFELSKEEAEHAVGHFEEFLNSYQIFD
ncbi:MAG: hypothetical protein UT50_C0002G0053 [Candidatus Moranbacteria bacterium GW2011_GWA2_39_41]|nr:MAG: hypothetical protein UT50_C0002G0053 [Candidatus Moranbacteria bacterium GW2011_GWA2_39_41]